MGDILPSSIGFECEFETGAADVIRYLHSTYGSDVVGMDELHSYHCDCRHCGDSFLFHGQNDSSCSGEIITSVITDWATMERATRLLQEAATETDAVPGYNSGFHVHIGRPRSTPNRRAAFFEILRFEQTLAQLAAGRFEVQRRNNRSLQTNLHYAVQQNIIGPWYSHEYDDTYPRNAGLFNFGQALEWIRHQPTQGEHKQTLMATQREADRHSNLNIRTRFETWEFRFWNSTRSAWRMQMWCGLSAAFANPQFVTHLMNTDGVPDEESVRNIIDALVFAEMTETAALVERQWTYNQAVSSGILAPDDFVTI